ncbi:ImmA/IrrE family metallo-endopeptidase [Paenibacillus apiarius]|uniref:ImmA/IrrE family metallo-endopeptidase n=1 Tax=Paenibacillus apiarius TaxID=46240 RepID=UPI003B3BA78F
MAYELLLKEAEQQGVEVYELPLQGRLKGLYHRNAICINRRLSQTTEKACILAEELGHYYTSAGNILDQTDIRNRKQELRARQWGYERLIPLSAFVPAHQAGVRSRHELAEFLNVTEEYLAAAIERYHERYGLFVDMGDTFLHFDPLDITYCYRTID